MTGVGLLAALGAEGHLVAEAEARGGVGRGGGGGSGAGHSAGRTAAVCRGERW